MCALISAALAEHRKETLWHPEEGKDNAAKVNRKDIILADNTDKDTGVDIFPGSGV